MEDKVTQNREDIIKIDGQLNLINQKLDNHITHISEKVDEISASLNKVKWLFAGGVMVLITRAVAGYMGLF